MMRSDARSDAKCFGGDGGRQMMVKKEEIILSEGRK